MTMTVLKKRKTNKWVETSISLNGKYKINFADLYDITIMLPDLKMTPLNLQINEAS